MGLLDITEKELQALPALQQANVKALLNIRQALFDILGAFPQDNVIPYFYSCQQVGAANTIGQPNGLLGANSTANNSIRISADSAFIAMSIRGTSDGDYSAFMRQDASDRQLMNIPVNSNALVGTAERPGPLHKPLLMPANTTISVDFADLSGQNNNIWFTLAGFKVYNRKLG